LAGVGFLDISKNALSSVYFVYDPDFSSFSPGVFSILKEIEIVRELGISYYNLGYWIQENNSMAYKGNYHPHQIYSWKNKLWSDETETMSNKKEIKSE
jgi:arginyl-tRNA--protein-N-Asp/Glu arginylyltransferase